MGASSERYSVFPSIPQAENVPSPKHMYSIEVNYIAYLEQFSTFWLSQTCVLDMSNIHF